MYSQNMLAMQSPAEFAFQMNQMYPPVTQHQWIQPNFGYNPYMIHNMNNNLAPVPTAMMSAPQMHPIQQQPLKLLLKSSEHNSQFVDSNLQPRCENQGQKSLSFSNSTVSCLKIEDSPATAVIGRNTITDSSFSPDSAPVLTEGNSISQSIQPSVSNLRVCGIAVLSKEQRETYSISIESSVRPKNVQKKTKQDYYNDSNYTKNLLKGFKRYLRRFEADLSRKAELEIFDGHQLNNELVLKLFSHPVFQKPFGKFLSQSPNWWIEQAKIKDVEKQVAFFHLCRNRAYNLIRTKRKTFQRPV